MDAGPANGEMASLPQKKPVVNARRAPKSQGGCLHCKAKRLKCDERKPECHHCLKKKVACTYAKKPLIWSTKHEKLLSASTPVPLSSSHRNGLSVPQGSQREDSKEFLLVNGSPALREDKPQRASESVLADRTGSLMPDSLSAIRQQLHQSTVPEFLTHLPTQLVEYYFTYVCQIFSSFDGRLNPFRSTVGKLWDGSAPIYFAIQSMAAAYLSNHLPRMRSVGLQMQREAFKCLSQAQRMGPETTSSLDKILLTVLLVGQTTAWHNPHDLGLMHLKTAKRLNNSRLQQQTSEIGLKEHRQNQFFAQCILYWDMLSGFVGDARDCDLEDGFTAASPGSTTASPATFAKEQVFPHPWTGVAPEAQRMFAQAGRLVRQHRQISSSECLLFSFESHHLDTGVSHEFLALLDLTAKAHDLEKQLLSFEPPAITSLVDAGDANTPAQHYIRLAEAFRCSALLEIYRVFPDILQKRVTIAGEATITGHLSAMLSSPQDSVEFLVSLAVHIVSILESMPSSSGTRCLQPILFITAACELRFESTNSSVPSNLDPFSAPIMNVAINGGISSRELDIATARRFVVNRLQEFQLSLPAKPIAKALQVIQETWDRSDLGHDVFWMDVMNEMGLQTIFG